MIVAARRGGSAGRQIHKQREGGYFFTAMPITHSARRTGASRPDKGARGKLVMEVGPVHAVEGVVGGEIGAENLDLHQIVHGHAGGRRGCVYRLHHELGFGFGGCAGLFGGGIQTDVAADIERVAEAHGIAKGRCLPVGRGQHDVRQCGGGRDQVRAHVRSSVKVEFSCGDLGRWPLGNRALRVIPEPPPCMRRNCRN